MKKKKFILGVTGIQSEYDIMSSVFLAVSKHSDFDLRPVVIDSHLREVVER